MAVSDFPPLLFTLPADQPPEYRTPRSIHSPLRDAASGSISTARRSITPPGSVHTDTTPPRPPPIMRLQDTLMDVDGPGANTPPSAGAAPGSLAAAAAASQQPGGGVMRLEPVLQCDDAWVTVYGFSPDDLPLVLREFQRCGDILQWGTFGASVQSNFMHVQYQNKYAAQRALLRSGEQLSGTLIVGVKPLEARFRQMIDAHGYGQSPGLLGAKTPQRPVRPYRVDAGAAQALPQRSRTLVQKLSEFVLGI